MSPSPGYSGAPFLLPPLGSPETKPAAAFHLHSCPLLQRRDIQTWAMNLGTHLLPGLFPTPSPAPGPPYPHSRGSLARVQPGRSGGQTDTSLPLPPTGCKSRLVRREMRVHQQPGLARSSTQRPHQILSPSSSCEEASSHCFTTRTPSSAITRGYLQRKHQDRIRTDSLHSTSLNPLPLLCAGGEHMRTHTLPLTDAAGASAGGHCLG